LADPSGPRSLLWSLYLVLYEDGSSSVSTPYTASIVVVFGVDSASVVRRAQFIHLTVAFKQSVVVLSYFVVILVNKLVRP
jgi:hypothetical protein